MRTCCCGRRSLGFAQHRHGACNGNRPLLLIEQIALECGYPVSSLKERVYAFAALRPNIPDRFGILIYTASAGLAPQIAEQMFQAIAKIRDGGHSILIVEQDIAGTLRIADYGYVMENGRITIEGKPALLRNDPQVLASYLGGQVS
jgi:ABC-type lipopolysaccharide export system ATPase subunit